MGDNGDMGERRGERREEGVCCHGAKEVSKDGIGVRSNRLNQQSEKNRSKNTLGSNF